jgi:CubicO group peptidase (beta-lactamase class C family)
VSDVLAARITPLVRIDGFAEPRQGILERMREHAVPGVQVAVIEAGEVSWSAGYGELEKGSGRVVDERSLFQAASISKPVTAFAVLRLVADGRLALDEPVNSFLRSWRLPDNELTTRRPVTLRALLSHTAGTTVHGFPGYPVGAALPTIPQILDGEAPANTKPVRVDIPVGEQFRYSGGGTMIVQQLLTDITGRRFPEVMQELALGPLGMVDSTYEQPLPTVLHAAAATAHDENGIVPGRWHVYPEMAAAGLWTTATDLARFVLGVQRALAGTSGSLIPTALAREMVTPQNGIRFGGLGPQLMGLEGDRRFIHSGGNRGFHSRFVGFVDHLDGIVILTNGPFTGAPLLNEIIGAVGAASSWPDFAVVDVALEGKTDDLERFVGDYELRDVILTVHRDASRLLLTGPYSRPNEMRRISECEFVLADTTRVMFEGDGLRTPRATLKQWGDTHVATRRETASAG